MSFGIEARMAGRFALIALLSILATFGTAWASSCDELTEARGQDDWALIEYQVGTLGIDTASLELEHASTADYADRLRECARSGQTSLPRDGFGRHTLFRYRPGNGLTELPGGRQLAFSPAGGLGEAVRGLDGNLALRFEIDAGGQILHRELLFASNPELGQRVLDFADDGFQVRSHGPAGSTFVDVVYLRFENGRPVAFSQLNYRTGAR